MRQKRLKKLKKILAKYVQHPALSLLLVIITAIATMLTVAWVGELAVSHLELQVSPPGYPEIGDFWDIFVYKVNLTKEEPPLREYAQNATIVVEILNKDETVSYYALFTNNEGRATFQYAPNHSEVCFQAFLRGYKASNRIVLRDRYVPPSTLTFLFSFSSGSLAFAGAVKYFSDKKKLPFRKTLFCILLIVMTISSFILFSTLYVLLYKSTSWGFPSEIISKYITIETLKILTFVTAILHVFAIFLIFLGYAKGVWVKKPSKGRKRASA